VRIIHWDPLLVDDDVMRGNRVINQIAARPPQPRQGTILVRCGEPALTDDIGDQDRSDRPRFRHGAPSGTR
jgi:hypothetical protein